MVHKVLWIDPESPSFIPQVERFECGQHKTFGHIIGGEVPKPGRYTFPVALGKDNTVNRLNISIGFIVIDR